MIRNIGCLLFKQKPFLLFAILFILVGCSDEKQKLAVSEETVAHNALYIAPVDATLPDAAGVESVRANCVTCHSTTYIKMQPAFPRKTWEKIVDKMIKTYGAPIADSSAQNIVNYLVAIKGKG